MFTSPHSIHGELHHTPALFLYKALCKAKIVTFGCNYIAPSLFCFVEYITYLLTNLREFSLTLTHGSFSVTILKEN